ncbi:DNA-binding transcription factor rap1 [Stygiomarasmius scandens]|uniref:DNA-binding transcription factor rap1 n=1 Tax=Marasmiellus scandens TaxID=2682957 RepID=A0ABR1JIA2_9AGAR
MRVICDAQVTFAYSGPMPLDRARVAYTSEDDQRLAEFIAKYGTVSNRRGNVIYKQLADNKDGLWPWSNRHSWHSWRDRYVKRQDIFDRAIRKIHAGTPTANASGSSQTNVNAQAESGPSAAAKATLSGGRSAEGRTSANAKAGPGPSTVAAGKKSGAQLAAGKEAVKRKRSQSPRDPEPILDRDTVCKKKQKKESTQAAGAITTSERRSESSGRVDSAESTETTPRQHSSKTDQKTICKVIHDDDSASEGDVTERVEAYKLLALDTQSDFQSIDPEELRKDLDGSSRKDDLLQKPFATLPKEAPSKRNGLGESNEALRLMDRGSPSAILAKTSSKPDTTPPSAKSASHTHGVVNNNIGENRRTYTPEPIVTDDKTVRISKSSSPTTSGPRTDAIIGPDSNHHGHPSRRSGGQLDDVNNNHRYTNLQFVPRARIVSGKATATTIRPHDDTTRAKAQSYSKPASKLKDVYRNPDARPSIPNKPVASLTVKNTQNLTIYKEKTRIVDATLDNELDSDSDVVLSSPPELISRPKIAPSEVCQGKPGHQSAIRESLAAGPGGRLRGTSGPSGSRATTEEESHSETESETETEIQQRSAIPKLHKSPVIRDTGHRRITSHLGGTQSPSTSSSKQMGRFGGESPVLEDTVPGGERDLEKDLIVDDMREIDATQHVGIDGVCWDDGMPVDIQDLELHLETQKDVGTMDVDDIVGLQTAGDVDEDKENRIEKVHLHSWLKPSREFFDSNTCSASTSRSSTCHHHPFSQTQTQAQPWMNESQPCSETSQPSQSPSDESQTQVTKDSRPTQVPPFVPDKDIQATLSSLRLLSTSMSDPRTPSPKARIRQTSSRELSPSSACNEVDAASHPDARRSDEARGVSSMLAGRGRKLLIKGAAVFSDDPEEADDEGDEESKEELQLSRCSSPSSLFSISPSPSPGKGVMGESEPTLSHPRDGTTHAQADQYLSHLAERYEFPEVYVRNLWKSMREDGDGEGFGIGEDLSEIHKMMEKLWTVKVDMLADWKSRREGQSTS